MLQLMPSSRIIKRVALSVKYNADIWGTSTQSIKYKQFQHRLLLLPRFFKDVEITLARLKKVKRIMQFRWQKVISKQTVRKLKSRVSTVLRERDPYLLYDRAKDQARVYRRRTAWSTHFVQAMRLKFYFGFFKEYQFRKFLRKARRVLSKNLPNTHAYILESNLATILLRAGFVKNIEIARYLIMFGFVTVNTRIVTDIHYQVPVFAAVRLCIPDYLFHSEYFKNRIYSYQRIVVPRHFEINWKLFQVRLIRAPRACHVTYPFITFSVPRLSFFYSG